MSVVNLRLERLAKIEHENGIMLKKVEGIMSRPPKDTSPPPKALTGSLNRESRIREQKKIQAENEVKQV